MLMFNAFILSLIPGVAGALRGREEEVEREPQSMASVLHSPLSLPLFFSKAVILSLMLGIVGHHTS